MTAPGKTPSFLHSPAISEALAEFMAAISRTGGVLISGETGTGRGAMARALHRAIAQCHGDTLDTYFEDGACPDDGRAFVVVDCASGQDIEMTLFGRQPSIESDGLDRVSAGSRLAAALDGTLFIRELQDMPRRVQMRLARVLRDGEVWLDDGSELKLVRLRPIAAIDAAFAADGDDRIAPELLRRLSESRIHLPPLRERREDIPGLVRQQLEDIGRSMNLPAKRASKQALAVLASLPWRRNLRELRGLLHTLVLKVQGPRIRLADVLNHIRLDGAPATVAIAGTLKEAREQFEREYVAAVLQQHNGRMAEAALALGIQRTNLYRKVRQLSVERPAGRRP